MSTSSVRVDVEEFLIEIKKDLEPEPADTHCCIYTVPNRLRKVNEEAYTPQLVSIGHLHHGKKELAVMEKKKKTYVNSFFEQITKEKQKEVLSFVEKNKQRIRDCYAETSKLESKDFVTMIIRDATFIIVLFRRKYEDQSDSLLDRLCFELTLDMQLLENQLPYFVPDEIYKLAFTSPEPNGRTFLHLCYHFFTGLTEIPDRLVDVKHFTDLRRKVLLNSCPSKVKSKFLGNLPCAEKLYESGVKFKCSESSCLLDVRFERRKQHIPCLKVSELQIPYLRVDYGTESEFRNMMALELCHYPNDARICHYIDFLDRLIDTEKDADLLEEGGIIFSSMGDSGSLANMLNKLCEGFDFGSSFYYDVGQELKAHYDNPWNRTKATLKSVYFNNLWRGTATVAAVILLVLTVIQTVCSIITLKR